jgi:hypothetical protein
MLYSGATITTDVIVSRFRVSASTAKRDMIAIEAVLPVTATKVGCRVHLTISARGAA